MSQSLESQEQTLDTAIENAFEGNNSPGETSETTEVETSESEETEEQGEESESSEELVEVSQADLDLLKQIRDPETRRATIQALAKAEKLIADKAEEVKGEKPLTAKQVAKTTRQIAEEVLGEEFNLLPEKFFDLFDQLVEDRLKPLADSQVETQKQAIQREVDTVYSSLADKYDDFTAHENFMNDLATEIPIKEGHTLEQHMLRLYKISKADNPDVKPLASSKKKEVVENDTERKVRIRIQRNSSEPTVKGTTPEREIKASKLLTLEESIQLAVKKHK